jgi:hypothetical protein
MFLTYATWIPSASIRCAQDHILHIYVITANHPQVLFRCYLDFTRDRALTRSCSHTPNQLSGSRSRLSLTDRHRLRRSIQTPLSQSRWVNLVMTHPKTRVIDPLAAQYITNGSRTIICPSGGSGNLNIGVVSRIWRKVKLERVILKFSGRRTAINVAGRNNVVKMAMIFILELSAPRAFVSSNRVCGISSCRSICLCAVIFDT